MAWSSALTDRSLSMKVPPPGQFTPLNWVEIEHRTSLMLHDRPWLLFSNIFARKGF